MYSKISEFDDSIDATYPQLTQMYYLNTDGVINILDVVSTVNFVVDILVPTDDEACAADYNDDGVINVLDIVSIVNIILN